MTKEDLNKILENHRIWLHEKEGGQRANFRGADLEYIDLSNADLRGADLSGVNFRNANLKGTNFEYAHLKDANLINADLRNSNLRCADLRNVRLNRADLRGADIDFSCLPLWCGSLSTHFDDKQLIQIAYHLVQAGLKSKNASDETKEELSKLIDFANKFHRVYECGKIVKEDKK